MVICVCGRPKHPINLVSSTLVSVRLWSTVTVSRRDGSLILKSERYLGMYSCRKLQESRTDTRSLCIVPDTYRSQCTKLRNSNVRCWMRDASRRREGESILVRGRANRRQNGRRSLLPSRRSRTALDTCRIFWRYLQLGFLPPVSRRSASTWKLCRVELDNPSWIRRACSFDIHT